MSAAQRIGCNYCGEAFPDGEPHLCPPQNDDDEFDPTIPAGFARCIPCGRLVDDIYEHMWKCFA